MAETSGSTAKKRGVITKTSVRRLMGDEGADIVADDAIQFLVQKLEEYAVKVTRVAVKHMKDHGRKRLDATEIRAVI